LIKLFFSSEWDKTTADTYEANFKDKPSGSIAYLFAQEGRKKNGIPITENALIRLTYVPIEWADGTGLCS